MYHEPSQFRKGHGNISLENASRHHNQIDKVRPNLRKRNMLSHVIFVLHSCTISLINHVFEFQKVTVNDPYHQRVTTSISFGSNDTDQSIM